LLRRLLLLPLLSPLLVTLLVASINPRPQVTLRLLTWRSPALPIGAWIAGAAVAGAGLSAAATALALQETGLRLQRRVRRSNQRAGYDGEPNGAMGSWGEAEPARSRPRREQTGGGQERGRAGAPSEGIPWSGDLPARAPGEAAPTVSVPYRVIRRGEERPFRSQPPFEAHGGARGGAPQPVAVDDWATTVSEEW
jgi:uncharacterized integral membrane protein